MKSQTVNPETSNERLLIFEDHDKIRAFNHRIDELPLKLKAVLRAYASLGVEGALTIEDIEHLIGRMEGIESWLRSRIIDHAVLPTIGGFALDRRIAEGLLTLPDYSVFEAALRDLHDDHDHRLSSFFEIEYAGNNGKVGLVRIKTEEVEKELERYRFYVESSDVPVYQGLEFVVDFLNKQIVGKYDKPHYRPGFFAPPRLWDNAERIEDAFKFNYALNRYEINLKFFRRLGQKQVIPWAR